jgi:hypothetical protein
LRGVFGERSGKMDNPFFRWFESLVWTEEWLGGRS